MADRRRTETAAKTPRARRERISEDDALDRKIEDKIDEASELSMDASDPPSFTHGTVGAGRGRRSTKDTDADLERRIRNRAYQIWLDEGCPEGRAEEHWLLAAEMIATEDKRGAGSRSR